MMADPFEVRMRFTAQLQHLSASVTSSQKAAHYALKYRDLDEDLHSCILEQLERNNMNNRANIMYFIEHFCEMATKENHLPYVRMLQRDMLRVVDAVVPPDGSGAANVKHVRRVLNGLQTKEVLSAETVAEIDAGLKERDTHPAHFDLEHDEGAEGGGKSKAGTPRSSRVTGIRVDKKQIEQRIEEDRERNKRLRESMWTVGGDDGQEHGKFWDEASDIGEDDFLVTAAKGLLTRQDAEEAHSTRPNTTTTTENKPKMVTTRRGDTATKDTAEPESSGTPVINGKRESGTVSAGKKEGQNKKRRRSNNTTETVEDSQDESPNGVPGIEEGPDSKQDQPGPSGKKNHIRFGSEEPALPEELQNESAPETGQENQEDDEESSDDDAPETINNSAQLSKIKSEAQKQEKARQREEQLRKEKRKQLDEQRKLQAKSSSKKKEVANADDLLSESTETLQGSNTQDARRSALPALLPDDILNAEPVARPLTPPADEIGPVHKKPNKLKFLDKVEKRPKDVKMNDMTIRVLDEGPSRKKAKTTLAPKASKSGRNTKQNWLNQSRSTANVNGLRKTTGGSSGFVRR